MNLPSFLMCPPEYFENAYRMTPWGYPRQKVNQKKALKQWQSCYDLLMSKLKVKVELLTPQRGLPNMVFTAHGGMVHKRLFVRANFRYRERVGEEQHYETWFRKKGYIVKTIPRPFCFEGEGNAVLFDRALYGGFHFRADLEAFELVSRYFKTGFYGLEICDEDFCCLDQCYAIINNETALIYPPAFEAYSECLLRENIPDIIKVSAAEARRLACNAIVIGKNVIMPEGCPKVTSDLEKRKFRVYPLDFSEFVKAGGGPKSLVLRIG